MVAFLEEMIETHEEALSESVKTVREYVRSRASELLPSFGFVHVTGLIAWRVDGTFAAIQARRQHLGRWDDNNGLTVVVDPSGEVWLGRAVPASRELEDALQQVAPNGQGVYVPCSNGEQITAKELLARIQEPYDDFGGKILPLPFPK